MDPRATILAELARGQALIAACLEPGGGHRIDAWGTTHWVDRERCLVFRRSDILEPSELADLYGRDYELEAGDVVDVFAALVTGNMARHGWGTAFTHVVNLFMVQPLVNPASASLVWIALHNILAVPEGTSDLAVVMRPMIFDMASYPASRRAAPAVRAAQAEFFGIWGRDLCPADWATLDDAAWAEACARLMASWHADLETYVFDVIARRVSSRASAMPAAVGSSGPGEHGQR